jgi:ribonuclease VapC
MRLGNQVVLDSSAILAVIFSEPGGDGVIGLLKGGLLSSVNFAEVLATLVLRGTPPNLARGQLLSLGCEVCSFELEDALIAGELVELTKQIGLSLGDRACLALAMRQKATVYTADKIWKKIPLGIEVELIR